MLREEEEEEEEHHSLTQATSSPAAQYGSQNKHQLSTGDSNCLMFFASMLDRQQKQNFHTNVSSTNLKLRVVKPVRSAL